VNAQFLAIAADPQIIPGVHHYCDEWCDYCPVTARCLEYRCTEQYRKSHGRRAADPTFGSVDEAAAFTRELSAVEGMRTDELDALMSSPPGRSGVQTSDPLAELAWEYAEQVAVLLQPLIVHWPAESAGATPGGPTPIETVLWYQLRIYLKVFRALVAKETQAGGAGSEEACGCAKLALVSIDRSLGALAQLATVLEPEDRRALQKTLVQLRDGLETRVPGARTYMRLGLDHPVACV
jgi:hypothetical protein